MKRVTKAFNCSSVSSSASGLAFSDEVEDHVGESKVGSNKVPPERTRRDGEAIGKTSRILAEDEGPRFKERWDGVEFDVLSSSSSSGTGAKTENPGVAGVREIMVRLEDISESTEEPVWDRERFCS